MNGYQNNISKNTGNFGALSNGASANQRRNLSPPSLASNQPSSGGYMGQGLGSIGFI